MSTMLLLVGGGGGRGCEHHAVVSFVKSRSSGVKLGQVCTNSSLVA